VGVVPAASDVFRALADSTRRELLDTLRAGEKTFSELRAPFDITAPSVAQHLQVLRDVGLVRSRRVGRHTYYRIRPEPLAEVADWLGAHRALTDPFGHPWRLRPWRRDATGTSKKGRP
jgi:DNA-binding transcriptional ArsR family regulator